MPGDDVAARVQKLEAQVEGLQKESERRPERTKPSVEAPLPIPPTLKYDDGVVWEDREAPFALRMKALIQLRYFLAKTEELVTESGAFLRAARLGWDGYALTPRLLYKFELEFGAGLVAPLDVYLEGRLSSHWTVRAGQMRVPFSRSWLTPEQLLLFPNRSIATEQFRYGYDIGAARPVQVAG